MKSSNTILLLLGGGALAYWASSGSHQVDDDIKAAAIPNAPTGVTRGLRNNNPGNIVKSSAVKFAGEVQPSQDSVFKQFISMAYGYRAMFKLLETYLFNGYNTITKIINHWAPGGSAGNDPASYIKFVSTYTGVDPNAILSYNFPLVIQNIVRAMSRVENGVTANDNDVIQGYALFQNKSISGMLPITKFLRPVNPVKPNRSVPNQATKVWRANGRRIVFANPGQVDHFVHEFDTNCPGGYVNYCDANFCYEKSCEDFDQATF